MQKNLNFKENVGYDTKWVFTVRDKDGNIKEQKTYKNLIPTVSRTQITKALSGNISTVTEIKVTHQELGTGVTAPANGDTGLETPTGATG